MADDQELTVINEIRSGGDVLSHSVILPPILEGCYTVTVEERVRRFVLGVPEMLERWISRRASPHTQRAYRQDLFTFIAFADIAWPAEAPGLFNVSVAQVHNYRDWMIARDDAPKTINRRISSLSGFSGSCVRSRPNSGCPSRLQILPIRNSSPAITPMRWKNAATSRLPKLVSYSDCPKERASSPTGTGPS